MATRIFTRTGGRYWLLVGALATLACSDAPEPAGPNTPPSSAQFAAVSQDPHPSQLAVAQAVPGFGGYFLDAAGVPSVYLIDASQRPAAEQALAGFLADQGFAAAVDAGPDRADR
jgi:hypothetical protein